MQFVRRVLGVLLSLAGVAAWGCGSDHITGPHGHPSPNAVHLQSDAGDYIGGGQTYDYTHANALITVTASGVHFGIGIHGDQYWSGDFGVPNTLSRIQPGSYAGLTRYPFSDPATGGLEWYGEGRGCNTLTGSFTVDSVTYRNDSLLAIDLRFEQHCEGGTAALHGTIHWRSDDTTAPPGPVNPPPSNLWQPAPGATPASGDFVYLQSDAGDYIGLGQTYTYATGFSVTASGGHVSVTVSGAQTWSGEFQTMSTLNQLEPGYYGNLERFPFNNPVKGGLDWFGEGRGCNTLAGWFAIDHVSYSNGTLTALTLRFEQDCEGGTAALHGVIHWGG